MALPASVATQAVSGGDRAYMTAHSGTGQEDFAAGAATRAAAQAAQVPEPHQNALAFQQSQRAATSGAADTVKMDAIRAALLAAAGSHTGASMATTLTALNALVVASGRTTAGTFTYSGS